MLIRRLIKKNKVRNNAILLGIIILSILLMMNLIRFHDNISNLIEVSISIISTVIIAYTLVSQHMHFKNLELLEIIKDFSDNLNSFKVFEAKYLRSHSSDLIFKHKGFRSLSRISEILKSHAYFCNEIMALRNDYYIFEEFLKNNEYFVLINSTNLHLSIIKNTIYDSGVEYSDPINRQYSFFELKYRKYISLDKLVIEKKLKELEHNGIHLSSEIEEINYEVFNIDSPGPYPNLVEFLKNYRIFPTHRTLYFHSLKIGRIEKSITPKPWPCGVNSELNYFVDETDIFWNNVMQSLKNLENNNTLKVPEDMDSLLVKIGYSRTMDSNDLWYVMWSYEVLKNDANEYSLIQK